MAAALLIRALMGLADAIALAQGGVRTVPIGGGVGLAATSPLWSAVLAFLALVGAAGLVARWPVGWLVALGACVGYLLSGLGDLAFVASAAAVNGRDVAVLVVANVVVPVVVIAGLLWTRPAFLPPARGPGVTRVRALPGHAGPPHARPVGEPPADPAATP
jgi:hypothetical protein